MHVSSGFLLLETAAGREGQVLELLSAMPGVTHRSVLYPQAIAVKIEGPLDAVGALAESLRRLEGVLSTRMYPAKNA